MTFSFSKRSDFCFHVTFQPGFTSYFELVSSARVLILAFPKNLKICSYRFKKLPKCFNSRTFPKTFTKMLQIPRLFLCGNQ